MGGHAVDYAARDVLELSPLRFWYIPHRFTLVPFGENDSPRIRLVDAAINLVGYNPLGLLLGLWARGRGRSRRRHVLLLVLATSAVSAGLETLQFGLATRHPSTTDLLLNTLGASIGILLVRAQWRESPRLLARHFRHRLRRVSHRPACATMPSDRHRVALARGGFHAAHPERLIGWPYQARGIALEHAVPVE